MGIYRPLVWVECPAAVALVDDLPAAGLVYQRTDRYEEFPSVDRAAVSTQDALLKGRADLTLFCSTLLFEREGPGCKQPCYVDHGVDYGHFAAAGDDPASEPAEMTAIAPPRLGFVGGIDAHTFDQTLFLEVARRLAQYQFVLIGSCSLPTGWCSLPNVTLLGRRPYEAVPGYMAACDVLIMPWNQNEWIEACNPVKLKEYLAVGRPVVTTDFAELRRYEGYVYRAKGPDEFAAQIRAALAQRPAPERLRQRVRAETWEAKAPGSWRVRTAGDYPFRLPRPGELFAMSCDRRKESLWR